MCFRTNTECYTYHLGARDSLRDFKRLSTRYAKYLVKKTILTVNSLSHVVEFQIFASSKTFSSCLYGPEVNAFQRACVESFDAVATITILKRRFFWSAYKTVDKTEIANVALEFGGKNVCNYKCGKV